MLHIPASRTAIALGLWGLVPFVVLSSCVWLVAPAWQESFAHALLTYGAAILSFLGGMHWGTAISGDDDPQKTWRYLYAVFPSLLAWVALLCPTDAGLFLVFLGLMVAFFVDRRIFAQKRWFVVLRAVLTAVATASLYAAYKALQH